MSPEDQAVYFNAVPLFILAGAYLMVLAALAPTLWRERRRVSTTDIALAGIFPGIAIPAAIFGALVLYDRAPLGGHVWPAFAATLIALIPALVFLRRWSEPAGVVMSGARAREAEQLVGVRDRELDAVASLVNALARTQEPVEAARALLTQVEAVGGAEFTALALVAKGEDEATGLLARANGKELAWWTEIRVHLHNEPSGIASAYFEAAPVSVYDVESSPLISRRLAQAAGAKSAAFVPLIVEERVTGVLVAATTEEKRAFAPEELRLMQALAGEAAIALDRTRSASALDQALERERLVGKISRRVRSVHDLDAVTRVAVTETGRALGACRCFIRLGEGDEPMPIRAEWFVEGLKPIGEAASALPASNLAARERRTVAIADALQSPELLDASLGGVETLTGLGTRSVLATPVIVFDRMIGVLGLHRQDARPVVAGRRAARRVGRARDRARAAHREPAGRERAANRRADRAAEGGADRDERARAGGGPPAARRRGRRIARRRGRRLLLARHRAGRPALRRGARPARGDRRLRVPRRPRSLRPRDRPRTARALGRLRQPRRVGPASCLRGLSQRDRCPDDAGPAR